MPPAGLKSPDSEPGASSALVWRRTFYPGVARVDAATKIVVSLGSDIADLEIKLLAASPHTVRGAILDSSGDPAANASLVLRAEVRGPPDYRAESDSDGALKSSAFCRVMAPSAIKGARYKDLGGMAGSEADALISPTRGI
jgi:hypothetical protein